MKKNVCSFWIIRASMFLTSNCSYLEECNKTNRRNTTQEQTGVYILSKIPSFSLVFEYLLISFTPGALFWPKYLPLKTQQTLKVFSNIQTYKWINYIIIHGLLYRSPCIITIFITIIIIIIIHPKNLQNKWIWKLNTKFKGLEIW